LNRCVTKGIFLSFRPNVHRTGPIEAASTQLVPYTPDSHRHRKSHSWQTPESIRWILSLTLIAERECNPWSSQRFFPKGSFLGKESCTVEDAFGKLWRLIGDDGPCELLLKSAAAIEAILCFFECLPHQVLIIKLLLNLMVDLLRGDLEALQGNCSI
jgi:hypothetical protein